MHVHVLSVCLRVWVHRSMLSHLITVCILCACVFVFVCMCICVCDSVWVVICVAWLIFRDVIWICNINLIPENPSSVLFHSNIIKLYFGASRFCTLLNKVPWSSKREHIPQNYTKWLWINYSFKKCIMPFCPKLILEISSNFLTVSSFLLTWYNT